MTMMTPEKWLSMFHISSHTSGLEAGDRFYYGHPMYRAALTSLPSLSANKGVIPS